MWNLTGQKRPDFALEPGPGQESVWDYPRPPIARRDNRRVEVKDGHSLIASTISSVRVMETASPPTFYIPPHDVTRDLLIRTAGSSICEWKGAAQYWSLARKPDSIIAWTYPRPRARFDMIKDFFAFYPGRLDCFVDGEHVAPQPGRFYGGWITADIAGPFKGAPGTGHW
ncbi:MAG: DUF427 domain-containing protein [Gammaproteobacteria bacterium]|nr:DUF427 domain-containing protein [Gammaproteobacteria bacterium]